MKYSKVVVKPKKNKENKQKKISIRYMWYNVMIMVILALYPFFIVNFVPPQVSLLLVGTWLISQAVEHTCHRKMDDVK